jgi:FdrA protein
MSGGTFASEAQVVFEDLGLSDVYSNVPFGSAALLDDPLVSRDNTVVDMGSDEFTVGRPHPMIDYSLRVKRILEEAEDPGVAVILIDVVLGFGSHPDPASELAVAVREASKRVAIVCSVTGTDGDPQGRRGVYMALAEAGAHIARTNAEASMVAGHIARIREGG